MTNLDLLKKIWQAVYDPSLDAGVIINKYFHRDYSQCINGVILNRDQYIDHVNEQKKNITINTFDYKHVLENGNELFALYYPKGINVNKTPIEGEVITYILFENEQIIKIHGQVRLVQGDLRDVDM